MTTLISRQYAFSAAHRIEGHPKCGRLHGHNYVVTIALSDTKLKEGMVLDYGVLDILVKPVIDALDHRYIVSTTNVEADDPYAQAALARGDAVAPGVDYSTAEELAEMIYAALSDLPYSIAWVEVRETAKSAAVYYPGQKWEGSGTSI